ncbi:MAG: DUF4906 domain-containing protein [Rikenellaceae bacterium]|nr:DUF4906 domain-containing protein [Rikenellaceae bacterium]
MKKIILLLLAAGVLGACNRSDRPDIVGDGLATFRLSPGSFDMKQTKLSAAQENTLSNVAVLQFDASGNFVKYIYKGGAVANNKLALDLTSGTSQTVVFVANVADAAPFKTFSGNLAACRALTRAVADEAALTAGNALVMYGEYRGNIIGGQTQAAVVMKRAVAKIELSYWVDIPDAADKHITFTLKSIRLRNVPKVMSYATPAEVYPAVSAAFGDYPAVAVTNQPTRDAKGSQVWYVAENKRGTGTAETASQKTDAALASGGEKATYLEMIGDYTRDGQTVELAYQLYLGADPVKDYNLKRNTIYKIDAVIKGANVVDMRISVTDGGGELGVDDEQPGSESGDVSMGGNRVANCYMVNPAATANDVKIPVIRVNEIYQDNICDRYGLLSVPGYRQKDSLPAVAMDGREWVGEVLWQDNSAPMVNITGRTIRTRNDNIVLRSTGVAGNCVVGLRRKGDGVLVWSWHLWITDYEPVTDYAGALSVGEVHQYKGWMQDNGKFIMDRNLGAASGPFDTGSWGLLYQWGRKDPFIGAAGTGTAAHAWYVPNGSGGFRAATEADLAKTAAGAGVNNIYNGIVNPTAFFTGGTNADWTQKNDLLWQDAEKSIFDPCPSGWRVPRSSIWANVAAGNMVWETTHGTGNTGVRLWNIVLGGPACYPAQGFRAAADGAVTAGSGSTANWSSTVSGNSSVAWGISASTPVPAAQARANGYPVRCVKE